jgi:hypothetical protein
MFEQESILNRFLLAGLEQVAADIPADRIGERAPGNGHPPVWVLGHLAICAELGLQVFGQPLKHLDWLKLFGPGSSDEVRGADRFSKQDLVRQILTDYPALCAAAQTAEPAAMSQPHGVGLLEGTPIETTGDLLAHLLSSHFAFHLAQLSAWRRAAGHPHLF